MEDVINLNFFNGIVNAPNSNFSQLIKFQNILFFSIFNSTIHLDHTYSLMHKYTNPNRLTRLVPIHFDLNFMRLVASTFSIFVM